MATDVDVQYFSHLNGLILGNNWGDLIRLLDKALVTGIDFTQITAASIDAQGDVHITLYAAHNAMLFQVVELTGFAPASFNQKYRIKGVPNTTQLILKPHTAIAETSITTIGAGKLASLGYEIIFRDTNDVKRVYRAKNPTAQHPFIRVDESLTSPDGTTGVYTSTYAKYAMVGLLEHMEHIDDFENPDVLQLPFDPAAPVSNWKITGIGTACVRGWSRWYYSRNTSGPTNSASDSSAPSGNRNFTIVGDSNELWFLPCSTTNGNNNSVYGCGVIENHIEGEVNQWFLSTSLNPRSAGTSWGQSSDSTIVQNSILLNSLSLDISGHAIGAALTGISFSNTGRGEYRNTTSAIPVNVVADNYLRGNFGIIYTSGNNLSGAVQSTPMLSESSMYINQSIHVTGASIGGVHFYLGELE
ncbi:hypothetical protein [Acinetobacter indicus]|uniref:hypothetical protein n=1 Tax=Acinetobacter indicus TaxID=756892 RepID=UPI000CEC33FB|nr:hypothetical protein [Acinetobacter indicus]